MISVILYGRNDAHGYNLHRRVALSLNCIAEVLTDPDDELIFVDYNTPDELPTFIEAISDTLTQRCLGLLRVLRVPAAIHDQRFAAHTHLPAIEPVARNVAARRANLSNRWLLSTNTDMIFAPLQDRSMSDICTDLEDGFYGLPRFELPEWLWEWLPRNDPRRAIAEIERLGPSLRLDEPTVSHEWIRFDAPGDFQLILREDFLAVDGFDEEMLRGYHVDSNLSRRLLLHRGGVESLEEQLSGYHCNHNRTRTVYHGSRVANDLHRFFFSIDKPELATQRTTWGLADVTVEEVPIRERVSARCAATLIDAIPTGPRVPSDAYGAPFSLTYDSGHVIPFIADTLVVSSLDATIGYAGANTTLERMLGEVVNGLGFKHPMAVARFDDLATIEQIARSVDVFVVDLGLDVSQADASLQAIGDGDFSQFPPALADALVALDRLVELERKRCRREKHPRPMVLVNSSSAFWDAYILAQFDCSYTTIHSRVRRATVKLVPEGDAAAIEREVTGAHRLMRWYTRRGLGGGSAVIRPGESIELAELHDYSGFGTGWAAPEDTGIWTQGPRSELKIGVDVIDESQYLLTLLVSMICTGSQESRRVDLLANDEHVATREFTDSVGRPWRLDLPACALGGSETELTLLVDNPRSPVDLGWSTDDRRLGIHIRTLTLEQVDRSVRVGEKVLFFEGSGAERFLGDGWSTLEPTGVWTVEERARLVFRLTDIAPTDVDLVLEGVPFVTAEHAEVEVEVSSRGEQLAAQVFRYGEPEQPVKVRLPRALMDEQGRASLELRLRDPARPVDLGLSSDPRRLGVCLRSLTVRQQRPRRLGVFLRSLTVRQQLWRSAR